MARMLLLGDFHINVKRKGGCLEANGGCKRVLCLDEALLQHEKEGAAV